MDLSPIYYLKGGPNMRQGLVEFNATFFIQIINALVLFGALTYILFNPVSKFMEKRTNRIQSSIDEAETNARETAELKAKYEEQLKDIRNERNVIIEEATKTAEVRSNEIIEAAKENSEKALERSRLQIEREKQKMMDELRGQISTLAIAAASQIIKKDLDEVAHYNMIQQFIDETGETQWKN